MRSKVMSAAFARFAMPVVLLALVLAMQLCRPDANLLSAENIKTIFLQASVLGFLSLGLSFVMIAGESDISFAGTLGMMSAVFTMLINAGVGYLPALGIVLVIGMAIGCFIAFIVTRFGFSAFIVSIAVMFMGLGIERSFNEGITIWLQNESVLSIGRMQWAAFSCWAGNSSRCSSSHSGSCRKRALALSCASWAPTDSPPWRPALRNGA